MGNNCNKLLLFWSLLALGEHEPLPSSYERLDHLRS
jgi:hypothetical protein